MVPISLAMKQFLYKDAKFGDLTDVFSQRKYYGATTVFCLFLASAYIVPFLLRGQFLVLKNCTFFALGVDAILAINTEKELVNETAVILVLFLVYSL